MRPRAQSIEQVKQAIAELKGKSLSVAVNRGRKKDSAYARNDHGYVPRGVYVPRGGGRYGIVFVFRRYLR